MRYFLFIISFIHLTSLAQFDPAGGEEGSHSIHRESGTIYGWADSIEFHPGWLQINDTGKGRVPSSADLAIGEADNRVLSLGDSGYVTYYFENPITDQPSYDFAIFENGFQAGNGYFLELAFVELSSDGIHFIRFYNESLADTNIQINLTGTSQPEYYHNLAGKHQSPYGTLFDISETGLDSVRYIRIVDVIGSIDSFGSRDSMGRPINDPWPSPFNSCGFDLDALALVNMNMVSMKSPLNVPLKLYPNPVLSGLAISWNFNRKYELYNMNGQLISTGMGSQAEINEPGMYSIRIYHNQSWHTQRILVQ